MATGKDALDSIIHLANEIRSKYPEGTVNEYGQDITEIDQLLTNLYDQIEEDEKEFGSN